MHVLNANHPTLCKCPTAVEVGSSTVLMCVFAPPGLRIRGTLASGLSEGGKAAQWLRRSANQLRRVALQIALVGRAKLA